MKNNQNKKKINDAVAAAVIGAAVLIICGIFFLMQRKNLSSDENMAAVVNIESDVYKVFLLKDYKDGEKYVYSMEKDGKSVHFVIQDGGIAFSDVDCPDKICENSGVLSKENDTAVCMPNRVSVRIMPESELSDEMKEKIEDFK